MMRLTYHPLQDRTQLTALIKLFILSRPTDTLSGLRCRTLFYQLYGIDIDHHEYAYVLDAMCTRGEVTYHSHNGGDTQYAIKPKVVENA